MHPDCTAPCQPSTSSAFQKQQPIKHETLKPSHPTHPANPFSLPTATFTALFEDDLFLQKLYELQQLELDHINDADTFCEPDFDFDSDPPLPAHPKHPPPRSDQELLKLITAQSAKKRKLISLLSPACLELLIDSLGLCQSSALAMVISNSCHPIDLSLDDIHTPGDGLFLLLKSVAARPLHLVAPAFSYLAKVKRLSEPLLWLFAALFANEQVLVEFVQRKGIDLVARGLASTTRQLLYSGPCIISSLMNLIDTDKHSLRSLNCDNDSTEGFTNFAPFGAIACTSATGNPVDVLLHNAAPHRRIRSAIWSYHFAPHEHRVGLYVTFPYTFLLKEIHILPHTVSVANCPAYVSVEVSRDGNFMTPIGPPINTVGLMAIKLQLNKSELVNTVQINLYR